MKLRTTELRKRRDSAARVTAKPARAKRQPTLLCSPGSIVRTGRKLIAEMESEWSVEWNKL